VGRSTESAFTEREEAQKLAGSPTDRTAKKKKRNIEIRVCVEKGEEKTMEQLYAIISWNRIDRGMERDQDAREDGPFQTV